MYYEVLYFQPCIAGDKDGTSRHDHHSYEFLVIRLDLAFLPQTNWILIRHLHKERPKTSSAPSCPNIHCLPCRKSVCVTFPLP